MALPEGTRLGPYEILSPIGAGGMGEVYRAKDTRLDRTVAIKVLPSHLSDDTELRQRFEREARAVSSLNHPHICTLHDVGQQDGIDYLVMEYLEGETLAARLAKRPLQTDQVLRYAIEISDALDKAHRQGVVHRDLKPGNIMVTKSGAKLLDFGLAKLRPAESGQGEALSALPTENRSLTGAGTILGTFQYMAPEQLEGKEADARTDIFAFGAVVHEMATGRKAFEGKSQASLIGAIMTSDPAPISTLQPMTPPALEHIVRRCLAKDRDDRFQTARDVTLELQWIAEGDSQTAATEPVVSRRRYRAHLLGGIIGAAVIGVVIGVLGIWNLRPRPPEVQRQVTRFAVEPSEDAPLSIEAVFPDVSISPDGKRIVYVARTAPNEMQLYLRELAQLEAIPIRGTEGRFAYAPFFSPDGSQIGFFDLGGLKKVSIQGGVPATLWDFQGFGGASWGNDDHIIVGSMNAGLFRLPAAGGKAEVLTTLDAERGEIAHGFPHILRGDNGVLFTVITSQVENWQLVSLPNGKRALLIGQKSGIVHALDPDRSGEILWQVRVGKGGIQGGVQWGSAADDRKMYVAVSDMTGEMVEHPELGREIRYDPIIGGGLYALHVATGKKAWYSPPPGCGDRRPCSPAQSAAVTMIPGVVFSGSIDGHLRAYSSQDGSILWDVDTVREYETINGLTARGGSLDAAGPTLVDGMLYVNSGYGFWGGMPGNVLLAFSVGGK